MICRVLVWYILGGAGWEWHVHVMRCFLITYKGQKVLYPTSTPCSLYYLPASIGGGWLLVHANAANFSKEDLGEITDVSPMFKIDLFRVWEESHSRSLFGTLSCLRLKWFCRFVFYFLLLLFAIWRASFNLNLPHMQSHSHRRVANCKMTNLLTRDVA